MQKNTLWLILIASGALRATDVVKLSEAMAQPIQAMENSLATFQRMVQAHPAVLTRHPDFTTQVIAARFLLRRCKKAAAHYDPLHEEYAGRLHSMVQRGLIRDEDDFDSQFSILMETHRADVGLFRDVQEKRLKAVLEIHRIMIALCESTIYLSLSLRLSNSTL